MVNKARKRRLWLEYGPMKCGVPPGEYYVKGGGSSKKATIAAVLRLQEFLHAGNLGPNQLLNLSDVCFFSIFNAGPKKSLQTILLSARHDMHVQMRHTLTHTIVHCQERAFRFKCNFYRARQQLHILEEWPHQLGRKIA